MQHLCYKLEQWNKTVTFSILYNISEYVTLVKLMDSLGNVNHAVNVVGKCIFLMTKNLSIDYLFIDFNLFLL